MVIVLAQHDPFVEISDLVGLRRLAIQEGISTTCRSDLEIFEAYLSVFFVHLGILRFLSQNY